MFYIKDKTRTDSSPRLCDTCRRALICRGAADSQELIYCSALGRQVTMRVLECNSYVGINDMTIFEMDQIAWKIDSKPGGKFGFQPPSDNVETKRLSPELESNPIVKRLTN